MHPMFRGIEEMTIDDVAGVMSVRTVEGETYTESLAAGARDPIERSTYRPAESTLEVLLSSGRSYRLEVDNGEPAERQLGGRTVVYLDQNKWIDLARARHAPERLSAEELTASQEFLLAARNGEVICPLSSGHVAETGGLSGRWREQLTDLMVDLSRGWIFRGVLSVRHDELAQSLTRVCWPTSQWHFPPVVTRDTTELFAGWPFHRPPPPPDIVSHFSSLLGGTAAIFAVLRDGEPTSDEESRPVLEGWAAGLTNNAARLVEVPPENKRAVTLAWFLQDLRVDLSAAASQLGVSGVAQLDAWTQGDVEGEIASLPYLGRLRDITDFRLRNAQDSWVHNDLVDVNNLSLGAAYADNVIGERKTIGLLRRASRDRPEGARLYTNFRSVAQNGRLRPPDG